MLTHPRPSVSPHQSPSRHPSPKQQFLTLSTDRPLLLSPRNDQNSLSARASPSPTDRNRTKIRLVSPLRRNKSNLTTNQNNPTPTNPIVKVASPNKHAQQIQLGENYQRQQQKNQNQISNISIKEHLKVREKKNIQENTVLSNKSNKYSAFVIMGTPSHVKTVQRVTVSPFKKQQGPLHITINNKRFDIPSLKPQIIHVSPFQHIKSHSLHTQVIKEQAQHSSLKDSCDVGLKEIKEMRKEMEIESDRLRLSLQASRINKQICLSHLEFVNVTEDRSEKRSSQKLFNFQDVPLQQSRLQVEEKQEKMEIVHESCTKIPTRNVISSQNQQKMLQARSSQGSLTFQQKQSAQHANGKQQFEIKRGSLRQPCINTQQTLINELDFMTNKGLTSQHSKDSVCVQTSIIGIGNNTERRKLAIIRNQECFISLVTKAAKIVEEQEEMQIQVKETQQVKLEQDNQLQCQIVSENFVVLNEQKITGSDEMLDQDIKEEQVSIIEEEQLIPKQQVKEKQLKKQQVVECHPSIPSIASEIVYISLKQSQVKSSHKKVQVQSNLSLQLQNIKNNHSPQSNITTEQIPVQKPVIEKIELGNSAKDAPGFMLLRSARSYKGELTSKRSAASKRSIHNGIYL